MNTSAIPRRKRLFWLLALLSAFLPGMSFAANCPALLNHTFNRLQDEAPQNLCQYAGKVTLVVNTASYCGFTSQYEGLEKLYAKYKDKGLVVLGFPSNDFSQEPDGDKKIADFCYNTYGVKFPMFSKSSVRGNEANSLFAALHKAGAKEPGWNFFKYLIDRDGILAPELEVAACRLSRQGVISCGFWHSHPQAVGAVQSERRPLPSRPSALFFPLQASRF